MVIINQRDAIFSWGVYSENRRHAMMKQHTAQAMPGKAYFLVFDYANNPGVIELFSTSSVNDGNWHFMKGERIGTTINLYIDGVLEATGNTPGS